MHHPLMNYEYFSYRVIIMLYCNISTNKNHLFDQRINVQLNMSKALTQIEPGTACTVKETGESGTLEKIFYYPTKYEVKTESGKINHYTTHEIIFEGYDRPPLKLNIPEIPYNGVGSSYASWIPFQANSQIRHHFSSSKKIVWEMITSLDTYNVWFSGIQRALPDVKSDRYVHKFSFDKLPLNPGSYFKIRPASLAPYFRCRIITVEKEKEFGFDFRMSPFYEEYISFKIDEAEKGIFVTCNRSSKGFFSFLSLLSWNSSKSKILQKLAAITPVIDFGETDEKSDDDNATNTWGGFASREDYINYAVNMGLQNNLDVINAIPDKPTRGLAKAGLVRAKRTGKVPPTPEKPAPGSAPSGDSTKNVDLSQEQIIAMVVNKALDGDMDPINALEDKPTRGKAKAMLVKIKRGAAERPPMPEIPDTAPENNESSESENEERLIERLIATGLSGDMEEINALENKVLRGKIKAAIVKAKRQK